MAGKILRGAIVGASTLLGKELAEELNASTTAAWDLTLLDGADAGGQITSAGDEALVIQPVSAEAFAGIDLVFFAGDTATAREYWKWAHSAGASIVDLTGALEGNPGVFVTSAWQEIGEGPDLSTMAIVAAHPMAALLALVAARFRPLGMERLVATVLLPASELGSAGVDELQQQAVGLLTFKTLQKDVYDAQVAFNLLNTLGTAAKVDLEKTRSTIVRQARELGVKPEEVVLQVLQAPVFHGYTASMFVEMTVTVDESDARRAIAGSVFHLAEDAGASNASAAGAAEVLVSLRPDDNGFWLWIAADNLRLAAKNAAGCAEELVALRPPAGVN